MADLIITPAVVVPHVVDELQPVIARYVAHEPIVAGQVVSILPSGKAGLHDTGLLEYEKAKGVSLNNASQGQPIDIIEAGFVSLGSVSTAGEPIVASHVSNGGLAPFSDLVIGNDVVAIGYMYSATILKVDIDNLGISKG